MMHQVSLFARLRAALLMGLCSLVAFGCSGPLQKPNVEVSEVHVADMDREAIRFTVVLRVHNPNGLSIGVSDIQAKLYLAEDEIGSAQAVQQHYTLPASASIQLPLRVTVPIKNLPEKLKRSALSLIAGGLPYSISGSLTAMNGLATVPFEKSGSLSMRR